MSVNFSEALAAYQRAQSQALKGPGGDDGLKPQGDVGQDFASLVRSAAQGVQERLQAGETATLKSAAGQADINDVVVAVSKAEMTLQTVVTLRDRAVQAYQDILRMPI
ncbi:flagellar hook-basal body protein FliE [Leptolyngbya valderiana BDU 20041]|nr:flagellar hook-basal body protein FliE [Leptolyngbya valderiana BDU 20041]